MATRWLPSAIAAATLLASAAALAQTPAPPQQPFLLSADSVDYDGDQGIVKATGNVEIIDGDRVLLADRLTYRQADDTVIASGNVALLEPGGNVIFAERVELSDGFKRGVISEIRIILAENERIAANGAVRGDGRTEMRKAVYSPCELCKENPTRAPLWQIKAFKVVHDEKARRIEYSDAFLEVFGIPILYTPYFSHPDPTVERKTGFLAPRYGASSVLGTSIETPYYFNIAPNMDATFSPKITTSEGPILGGEFRHRTANGSYEVSASLTRADERSGGVKTGREKNRGHVRGAGLFDVDQTWRWGFDALRSTDDAYLSRYGIPGGGSTLTSTLFAEGFRDSSYASAIAYSFQDIRATGNPDEVPLILPLVTYQAIGRPDRRGARWRVDADLMSLTRDRGADSHRVSLAAGWTLPYVSQLGDVYALTAKLRGDLYLVNDQAIKGSSDFDGVTGRLVPEIAASWRFPLLRSVGRIRQVVEPIASIVVSPYGGNPVKIPNEDSREFEFDDTNVFTTNRFTGLDRIEGGPRINYGLRLGAYGSGGGSTTALVGQSYRLKKDDTFEVGSGLEEHFSDIVGRVSVNPSPVLSLDYRFRLDHADLAPRRNDIALALGPTSARVTLGYLFVDEERDFLGITSREEVTSSARVAVSRYWTASGSLRRDLGNEAMISASLGLTYQDECTTFTVEAVRSYTRDRDIEPSTDLVFRIRLKNLG